MSIQPNARPGDTFCVIIALIVANVLAYLLVPVNSALYEGLYFSPGLCFEEGQVWRLISGAFLHGSFWHLFFNMWGLYLFGSMIAPYIRPCAFFSLYMLSLIVGFGLFSLCNYSSAAIGASGAVAGVSVAAVMICPNYRIMLLIAPLPMTMKTFFWIFLFLELLMNFSAHDNVAHMAHVGGFIGAYLYLRITGQFVYDPFFALFGAGNRKAVAQYTFVPGPAHAESFTVKDGEAPGPSRAEFERLLKKVADEGINSLSPQEYEALRRAREAFRKSS